MMNLMLISSFMKGVIPESVVSEERLKEIYDVPETAQLWEKIVSHENYENLFTRAARFLSERSGEQFSEVKAFTDKTMKKERVLEAMLICAQKGGTFDDAMKASLQQFLEKLDDRTAEQIDAISTEAENHINLISSSVFTPF